MQFQAGPHKKRNTSVTYSQVVFYLMYVREWTMNQNETGLDTQVLKVAPGCFLCLFQ